MSIAIHNIFVFEDDQYVNFLPLTYLRPVYDLISGMSPLLAKVFRQFPDANISLHCRDYLKHSVKQNHAGIGVNNINTGSACLLINGRILANSDLTSKLNLDGRDRIFINSEEEVIAAYLNTNNLYIIREMLDDVFNSRKIISALRNKTEITHVELTLIEYPWDLIQENPGQIAADFAAAVPSGIIKGELHSEVSIIDEYKLFIGTGASVHPGVVLNAEKGPIFIGENCEIKPHTYIEGPVYIGNHTIVANSTLQGGASIGPRSMVNNCSLNNCIFHGYSDLTHVALSSSYAADFVSIDYHSYNHDKLLPFGKEPEIYIDGTEIETGAPCLGLFVADFSRIGAHNKIGPGSVMGIASFFEIGNDTLPKYMPSFILQTSTNRFDELTEKETLERIKYYLAQKQIELTKVELDLISYVHGEFPRDRKVSGIIY